MAWTDLALLGEVVSAVKQHWGLTRPDVTTPPVRLTNTDLPSAGFCFTAALFHPHFSPNETRWSFPICCLLSVCWLEINRKAEGGILRSQKKKVDLVLCWVGLLEFVASQSAPTAVGLAFKCTLRRKLAFCFLLLLPQTNTQRLNTSVLKMRNGPSSCYFRGLLRATTHSPASPTSVASLPSQATSPQRASPPSSRVVAVFWCGCSSEPQETQTGVCEAGDATHRHPCSGLFAVRWHQSQRLEQRAASRQNKIACLCGQNTLMHCCFHTAPLDGSVCSSVSFTRSLFHGL